jgi:hypothetical protein
MTITRRTLLQLGALSPLTALFPKTARAQSAPPLRLLVWFQGNGVPERLYSPTGGELDFSYPDLAPGRPHPLSPLSPYKSRTLHFGALERVSAASKAPNGLTNFAATTGADADKGHGAWNSLLSGQVVRNGVAQGETIDQRIARAVGASTRFKSLQAGLEPNAGLSQLGTGAPLPSIGDPQTLFDTVFTGISSNGQPSAEALALARRMRRRKSVLDLVHADFARLRGALSKNDRQRLEAHEQMLRDVEVRLTTAPEVMATCRAPVLPSPVPRGGGNYSNPANAPAVSRLLLEQMALAFACDLTRVGTFTWNGAATNQMFTWLGISDWFHTLSHDYYVFSPEGYVADKEEKLRQINFWYAEQLAWFLNRLSQFPEADGSTVLDNTVVMVVSELGHGASHTNSNLPVRLYGSARGALRTGRYLKLPATPLNNLYVSLAQAFGLPDTSFGQARFEFDQSDETTSHQRVHRVYDVGAIAALR